MGAIPRSGGYSKGICSNFTLAHARSSLLNKGMLEECLHCQSQASMTRRSSVDSDLDCVRVGPRNGPSGSGRAGTRTVRCRSPDKPMLLISSSHEKHLPGIT